MRVAVTSKAFSRNAALVQYLGDRFPAFKLASGSRQMTEVELIEFLSDVDAVILALERITPEVLRALPHLRVISKFGVGTDNIDFAACEAHRVPVLVRPGVNRESVAELSLATTLMLMRNVYQASQQLSRGTWHKDGGIGLFDRTVGLIGFGQVGTAFAELLAPFRCRVLVSDIVDKSADCARLNATQVSLETVLTESDVVSLHCPLSPETTGLVDRRFFGAMKQGAILVNTARGEIVDFEALKAALRDGRLRGAAVDVYETEPPTDLSLLGLPNLIPTPHIGGNSAQATWAMGVSAVDMLAEFSRCRTC